MSELRLDLGSLDLVNADIGAHDYWFETLADGYSLGAPEAALVVAASLMRDGDDERIDRYGNRTITFTVVARGPDSGALADAEAALQAELGRRNVLLWTPPDGFGPTTAFDVVTSWMDAVFDDLAEIRAGIKERRYAVTLRCEPHVRPPEPVTQTFTPSATPTPTVVDNCSSAAKWSEYGTVAAVTLDGESVIKQSTTVHPSSYNRQVRTRIRWNGTLPEADYVAAEIRVESVERSLVSVTLADAPPVAAQTVMHGGTAYVRYTWERPATNFAYDFEITMSAAVYGDTFTVYIATLDITSAPSGVQTLRVAGSVRAPGSVTATRATDMSWLFLYSDPALLTGFDPAEPASWASAPEGTYTVYAKDWGAAGDVLSLTFTDVAGRASTATTRLKDSFPTFRPIGEVRLGGLRSGLAGAQTVTATLNGEAATVPDELRLFRKHEDAALTYLDGIAANTVEMATPDANLPRGGLWADNVSALDKAVARAYPMLVLPITALWTEADDSTLYPITTTASYFPRSHTFNAYGPAA